MEFKDKNIIVCKKQCSVCVDKQQKVGHCLILEPRIPRILQKILLDQMETIGEGFAKLFIHLWNAHDVSSCEDLH